MDFPLTVKSKDITAAFILRLYERGEILLTDNVSDYLSELKIHFNNLSKKYGEQFIIPKQILRSSANRKIRASRKKEALELIKAYRDIYGSDETIKKLQAKAKAIEKEPDPLVDYYLSLPAPKTEEEVTQYIGKWKGVLKAGKKSDIDLNLEHVISLIDGKLEMYSTINNNYKFKQAFLGFNKEGEFVFGRKHGAGGIYLSISTLSKDGTLLTGKEDLIGVTPPPGIPAFIPNTFEFIKQ